MEENPKIFTIERSRLHKSFCLAKAINTAIEGETIICQYIGLPVALMALLVLKSFYVLKKLSVNKWLDIALY